MSNTDVDDQSPGVWQVESTSGEKFTSRFLYMCSGYYKYDQGHSPDFNGTQDFLEGGETVDNEKRIIVHAQTWNDSKYDYKGKNVAIVGSGATAITMVPAMVQSGVRQVVMIQRSPTYIYPLSAGKDILVNFVPYGYVRGRHMRRMKVSLNYALRHCHLKFSNQLISLF